MAKFDSTCGLYGWGISFRSKGKCHKEASGAMGQVAVINLFLPPPPVNYYLLLLNGNSIYGLCFTFRTNEFMRSYSNYKFIISISIFNRMALWRTLYLQSNIKEVLCLSFYISISSLCFSSFSYF